MLDVRQKSVRFMRSKSLSSVASVGARELESTSPAMGRAGTLCLLTPVHMRPLMSTLRWETSCLFSTHSLTVLAANKLTTTHYLFVRSCHDCRHTAMETSAFPLA